MKASGPTSAHLRSVSVSAPEPASQVRGEAPLITRLDFGARTSSTREGRQLRAAWHTTWNKQADRRHGRIEHHNTGTGNQAPHASHRSHETIQAAHQTSARSTSSPTWTPTATRWTAHGPIGSGCPRTFPPPASGRSPSTTTRAAPRCRPRSATHGTAARRTPHRPPAPNRTAPHSSTSRPPSPTTAHPGTGSKPTPQRAGSPSCGSTARSSPSSTRPGDPANSNSCAGALTGLNGP